MDGAALARHIGWDIGIRQVGARLADGMDAMFIHQPYSRLVIDCNRQPHSPEAILAESDGTPVPGNRGLEAAAVVARLQAIHQPYHAAIAAALAERLRAGRPTVLVALHSFTPQMNGVRRPWHVGILHDRGNSVFARSLVEHIAAFPGVCVGDNEPYRMDGTDYTVPVHAYPDLLPYAEIEIRQDLLVGPEGIRRWSELLQRALTETLVATAILAP